MPSATGAYAFQWSTDYASHAHGMAISVLPYDYTDATGLTTTQTI